MEYTVLNNGVKFLWKVFGVFQVPMQMNASRLSAQPCRQAITYRYSSSLLQ